MSFSTIARAAEDPALNNRVRSAVNREALNNPQFGDSYFGQQVQSGFANYTSMNWAVANDTEAAYETALLAGRGCPGFDADIITDAQITAAVQAHWPPDPIPPPTTQTTAVATSSIDSRLSTDAPAVPESDTIVVDVPEGS